MAISPPHEHGVFLRQTEPRGGLARAGDGAGVAGVAQEGGQRAGGGSDAGGTGEDVEGGALALQEG